jgi:hypothetical protein
MVETAHAPLGAPFLLMERIDGPLLLDAFVGGDESRRQELLMLFCRMLASLHALDWRMAPPALASWTDAVRDPTDPYAFIDRESTHWGCALARRSSCDGRAHTFAECMRYSRIAPTVWGLQRSRGSWER